MLDGRIDTQGIVKDLRNRGELDFIAHDSVHESEGSTANKPTSAEDAAAAVLSSMEDKTLGAETGEVKKPRKLVEDEARATGKVKWGIYKTYLEAW